MAISGALGAAAELCGSRLAGAEAELLRRLAENSRALLALDAAGTALRLAPLDLGDVLMGILPGWTRSTPRHSFELALPGSLPTVIADAALAERALDALLAAAVRASPEGAVVRTSVRAARDAVEVVVSAEPVRLQGGLPGDAVEVDLFATEPIRPTNALTTPNAALDLTLARAALERHGGRACSRPRRLPSGGRGIDLVTTWPLVPPPAALPASLPIATEVAAPTDASPSLAARRAPVVLLVAGDARMGRYLRGNLEAQGYAVVVAANLEDARRQADLAAPDLALLDAATGGSAGESGETTALPSVLAALDCPTIVLAAQSDPMACAHALDCGAADWVARPFSVEELLARVRAVQRRSARSEVTAQAFMCGELAIDFAQRLVTISGAPVPLSKTEYKLLRTLAQHPGRVLGHETLLERVWGPGYADAVEFLWVYVRRLRRKIESDPAHPRYIETIPGVGYRLAPA